MYFGLIEKCLSNLVVLVRSCGAIQSSIKITSNFSLNFLNTIFQDCGGNFFFFFIIIVIITFWKPTLSSCFKARLKFPDDFGLCSFAIIEELCDYSVLQKYNK
jgi:hypothetical protein